MQGLSAKHDVPHFYFSSVMYRKRTRTHQEMR